MKYRIAALLLCLGLGLSLCACSSDTNGGLNAAPSPYSATIAYATEARGGVSLSDSALGHSVTNRTVRLDFGTGREELLALSSRQTGEILLKNTFVTTLTTADGRTAVITGGNDRVEQGQYGVGHRRTEQNVAIPALPSEATLLKEYAPNGKGLSDFSALNNDLSSEMTDAGLKITSEGKNRSQFGARFLDLDLGEHDKYYLSITLKTTGLSGLKCFFSTTDTPLTESTVLGTLQLTDSAEFVTLTAPIENANWKGVLQTLLFRLPEGETGTAEISRIALFAADSTSDPEVADTLWTVYSDRIYFSQVLNFNTVSYQSVTTSVSVSTAKCTQVIESEHSVGLKMIDGSIFGVTRPASGASLTVEKTDEEIRLIFQWDLSQSTPMLATRVYLNYTDSTAELDRIAAEERNPLSADNFLLEGAEFVRYDPRGGMYRLNATSDGVSVTVKGGNRRIYMHMPPTQSTVWKVCDKEENRLPIFAGETFPLCPSGSDLTLRLKGETRPREVESPEFFPDSGLDQISRTSTVLNGLCVQNTTVYGAKDGSYTVTLVTTRLNDGTCTVYDIQYDFLGRKQVSDLLKVFPFFSFELTYGFEEFFYLNGENEAVTVTAGDEDVVYLGSMPYIGMKNDTEAAGWLITTSAMTASGESSTALLALRYEEVSEQSPNRLYLAFDAGETDFVRGDTLTARVIRTDSDPSAERLSTLRAAGNFQLIQTKHRSEESFTAAGMESTVILQVEGFDDYRFPQIKADGEIITPEYHVYVDEKGYYGFAFSVKTGSVISIE